MDDLQRRRVDGHDLGRRGLDVYLLCIAALAVIFGEITDLIWPVFPTWFAGTSETDTTAGGAFSWPIGVAFLILLLNGIRVRFYTRG